MRNKRDFREPFPVIGGEVVGVETMDHVALGAAGTAAEPRAVGAFEPCQGLLQDGLRGRSIPTQPSRIARL